MTLVDTSAWVEYLRGTDNEVARSVRTALARPAELHTTDVVVMEVTAGGRDEAHVRQLRRLLMRCEFLASAGLEDFEAAASLYHRCRRAGETARALNDCLIGAVAIRSDLEVLQADRDFDVLARHTELRLASI